MNFFFFFGRVKELKEFVGVIEVVKSTADNFRASTAILSTVSDTVLIIPISGRVDRASAIETVDSSSIPRRS